MSNEIAAPEGAIVNDKAVADTEPQPKPRKTRKRSKVVEKLSADEAAQAFADASEKMEEPQEPPKVEEKPVDVNTALSSLKALQAQISKQIEGIQKSLGAGKSPRSEAEKAPQKERTLQECNRQYFEASKQDAEAKVKAAELLDEVFTNHVNLKTGEKTVRRIQRALR